ncbi:MAG: hypothetical protein JWP12_1411 [Bacteroidetes bacterium]|nr:hypothetical protein [Bacteroidota bacterium]
MKKSEGAKIEKELKLLGHQIRSGTLTCGEIERAIIKMKAQVIKLKATYMEIVNKEN